MCGTSEEISYWFLQCFFDVGRFAHRTLVKRKNVEKTVVLDSTIEAGGVPGTLGRANLSAKTAKSGEKARSKCLRGLRKFISGLERSNFERESANVSGLGRAGLRMTRMLFSESSNGFRFWLGGAAPQTPPLNGRPQHLIEAAKRGRLDQMLFFRGRRRPSATTVRGRTPGRTSGRTWLSKKRVSWKRLLRSVSKKSS